MSDLSGPAIQEALARQQGQAQPIPSLPTPQPVNANGAQLGGGLTMPQYSAPMPSASPQSPAATAPLAKRSDLEANANLSEMARWQSDPKFMRGVTEQEVRELDRRKLIKQLEAAGASPHGAKADATRIDRERPAGVANPFAGGGGAGGSGGAATPKDMRAESKAALGMTKEWERAHNQELAAADEGQRQADVDAAEQYRLGQLKSAGLKGMGDAQDVLAKEEAARQAAHAQEVERKKLEVQRLHDDAANDRIDPSRVWKNNPAGSVLAVLGSIAGGIQTAYTHGPNQALEMINRTVDRDVAAQKEAHAFKREKAQAGDRMLDKLREQGLDEAGQRAAMRNIALSKGQLGLQAIAADSDNQQFKTKANQLHVALEAEKAKNQATIEQQIGATQYALEHPKATGGGGESAKDDLSQNVAREEIGNVRRDEGGDIAGYTLTDRLRHWAADKTGLNLESTEAKGNRRNVEALIGQVQKKDIGMRTNPETIEKEATKSVRTQEDVERFLSEQGGKLDRESILAALKKGQKAPARRKAVEVDEGD